MDNIRINYQPSGEELNKLEDWLQKEYQLQRKGFYGNWSIIENAFEDDQLVLLNKLEDVIGFVVWGKYDIFSVIDIMEIRSDFRGNGLGKFLYDSIETLMISIGAIAIKIFCEPRESKHFWKKMGFIHFHKSKEYTSSDLTFYKPLIETQKFAKYSSSNRLELWDLVPYKATKKTPKWTWNLDDENGILSKPILHPCSQKWKIRLIQNGKKVREEEVKYFSNQGKEIHFGSFLFINALPI